MAATQIVRPRRSRFQDPAEAAFTGLLVAAGHAIQQLDVACGQHGITHVQYDVLRILRRAQPDGLPRFEVANRLVTRAPDVTRLLDRLHRQGLVTRGWRPDNRRQSIARITRQGLDVLEALDPWVREIRSATLAPLSDVQVLQLAEAFDTMLS
jgi:MarR family transcriptional regulator, organic hydroperoxide resistance regulator